MSGRQAVSGRQKYSNNRQVKEKTSQEKWLNKWKWREKQKKEIKKGGHAFMFYESMLFVGDKKMGYGPHRFIKVGFWILTD